LAGKKKFKKKFDVIVNSFIVSPMLKNEKFKEVMNDKCIVYQETADYCVPLKRDFRKTVKSNYEADGKKLGSSRRTRRRTCGHSGTLQGDECVPCRCYQTRKLKVEGGLREIKAS